MASARQGEARAHEPVGGQRRPIFDRVSHTNERRDQIQYRNSGRSGDGVPRRDNYYNDKRALRDNTRGNRDDPHGLSRPVGGYPAHVRSFAARSDKQDFHVNEEHTATYNLPRVQLQNNHNRGDRETTADKQVFEDESDASGY
jgi:hypothetical protein